MKNSFLISVFIIIFGFNSNCQQPIASWTNLMKIDTIFDNNNVLKKALEFQLIKEKHNEKSDSIYAKVLHIIGRSYWYLGNYELGIKNIKQSILVNKKNLKKSNDIHLALSYYVLAFLFYDTQSYDDANSNFDNCIKILSKIHLRSDLLANSYLIKSSIFYIFGDYEKAMQNADRIIAMEESPFYDKISGYALKSQSLLAIKSYPKFEITINQAIDFAQINFPKSVPQANLFYLNGDYLLKKNNFFKAQVYLQKSIQIFKLNKDFISISSVYQSIADYFLEQKNLNDAINYYNKSIKQANKHQLSVLRALDKLGIIYRLQKNYTLSLQTYQKAFSKFLKKSDIENLSINPNPRLIAGKGDNEVFLDLIQHKAETWLAYYHYTNKKEYLQNALETFAVADKMVDYMRREHVGYQSKLFWRDKTHSLYENAIEVCYLLKNFEKGFYFFEKSRAVLLNDKINNLSANQLLSEADQLKERSFQQEISELNSKIESETVEAKKSQLNVKMLDIQESQQKFIGGLAVKYPSYFAFKYDTSMYNLGQLRQYLQKSNTSFIEYFKGDSANYQLVIKPTGLNIIKQKPSENSYEYLINAADLGKRVIISQDGEFVPLDTLKNTKGEILLKKYAFSNTYSAQYLLRNAEKKVTNSWLNNFIGFAPVNYSKSMALPSLLGADEALANVSGNYFWSKNYEKEKASKANFTKMASDYKIIQLFTHADADNANKEPTIFFADSAMKVSELESFPKFNTELLVLSACKTNVGKVAKGEGTLSMAREFAGLGIPATITTLWSVENEATYQITKLFYKYLKNGEPKDVALQKAKLEYLEINSREKQDPKYWAAFVLMGETAPLAGFDGRIIYIGLLIFAVILGLILYYKRHKKLIVK